MSQSVGPVLYATRLRVPLPEAYATLTDRAEVSVSVASRTLGLGSTACDGTTSDDDEMLPAGLPACEYAPWLSECGCLSLDVRSPWPAPVVEELRANLGGQVLGTHAPTEMGMNFGPHHVVDPATGRRSTWWRPALVSVHLWGYSTPLDGDAYERSLRRSPELARLRGELLRVAPHCRVAFLWSY
ncbi:MAG: hypothetical protein HZB16_10205 [Armatimonadetes bacterium]|nr:hypothetical protein [Armatimonadota bacterium]